MKAQVGFTLIELIVTILIVSVLASIAYPSYINSISKTKRRAAEACLSNFATHMERFYTSNLRYDQDSAGAPLTTLPPLDCASTQNSGADYQFRLSVQTRSTYTLQAVPGTVQAKRDAHCGTLTLDQTGARGAHSTDCW